jgi:hypothetical protein
MVVLVVVVVYLLLVVVSVLKSGCSNRKKPVVQPNWDRFFRNHRLRFWLNLIGPVLVFSYWEIKKNLKKPTATGCNRFFR